MRKKLVITLVIAALLGGGGLVARYVLGSHLLVLEDGKTLQAQKVWVDGDTVFYIAEHKVGAVDGMQVKRWVGRYSLSAEDLRCRIGHLWRRWTEKPVPGPSPTETGDRPGFFDDFHAGGAVWLAAAVVVFGGIVLVWMRLKKRAAARSETVKEQQDIKIRTAPRVIGLDDVADFFLTLFKVQNGTDPGIPGSVKPLFSAPEAAGRLYELQVEIDGKLKTRRVSIRPLGEQSGSKSQCFYAIFDTHIVLKIPPKPIRDLDDYLGRIRYESYIVKDLAPRKCIVPNVSVIMDRIHHFEGRGSISPAQVEAQSVRLLKTSDLYRSCFKINGAFVFFMDLSRDRFLGDAMASLQGDDRRAVVQEDAQEGYDCQGFESKYGAEHTRVCFELQQLCTQFDRALEQARGAAGMTESLAEGFKKNWFFSHMADLPAAGSQQRASERLKAIGARLLHQYTAENADLHRTYRNLVREQSRRRAFRRSRPAIEAIANNLLDLLAGLEASRTAIRDLKPDNLLVVGDPADYPRFLLSAALFRIGLIDLETAVVWGRRADSFCPQPQLGGTPPYATPSHFFTNTVLEKHYPQIGKILHMQDWHAVTAIVFEIVTGRRLFQQTARQIPETIRTLHVALKKGQPAEDVYASINDRFWKQAKAEVVQQIDRHKEPLAAIGMVLPDAVRTKIASFLDGETLRIAASIDGTIAAQALIKNPAQKEKLAAATYDTVCRTLQRYEKQSGPAMSRTIDFLRSLKPLKNEQERHATMRRRLEDPSTHLTAHDILPLMFETAAQTMAVAAAPAPLPEPAADATQGAPLASDEAETLGYTHTIEAV